MANTVNIHQAKTHLPRLVDAVAAGAEIKNTNAVATFGDVSFAPGRCGYVVAPYTPQELANGSKALQ